MNRRLLFFPLILLGCRPAAAKMKETPLSDRLASHLTEVRAQAIQEFHQLPRDTQEQFVPSLMVEMTDEDPGVRADAAALLKELGLARQQTPPLTPQEVAEKQAARDAERREELQEIQKAKKDSFGDLEREMDQEKKSETEISRRDLQPSREGAGVSAALLEGLRDSDSWVRARSARKLSLIHPAPVEAIPDLIKMLDDSDTEARARAAGALASMGPAAQSAAPALLQHLGDPNPGVRQIVAEALHSVQPNRP